MKRLALGTALVLSALGTSTANAAGWALTNRILTPRYDHTATLLTDGRVLVAGGWNTGPLASAEIYDPVSRLWAATGAMATARSGHTATLLADGTVLVAGGAGASGAIASSEIYNPKTGAWHNVAGGLVSGPRASHTATLLRDGSVLIAGGTDASGAPLATAERYFPALGGWQGTTAMQIGHTQHTATLLADGRVVVTGSGLFGSGGSGREIYNPSTSQWSQAADFIVDGGAMTDPITRLLHSSTLLPDGRVLSVGGGLGGGRWTSNEIYDPLANTATQVADLASPLGDGLAELSATLLPDGSVLVAGGINAPPGGSSPAGDPAGVAQNAVNIYTPASDIWTLAPSLNHARTHHTATLLPDGRVLIVGGIDPHTTNFTFRLFVEGDPVADVELYDPTSPGTITPIPPFGASLPEGSPAVLLPSGKVLLPTAGQVFDPATGLRSATTSPLNPHVDGTATLLPSGKVLLTGGSSGSSVEIFDPATELWAPTGSLAVARQGHTATLLPDGRVLVAGGGTAVTEVYSPGTGTWTAAGALSSPRTGQSASLLADGRVLVAGGFFTDASGANFLGSAETFDATTGVWSPTGSLGTPRAFHTATLLPDGRVLATGGVKNDLTLSGADEGGLASAEVYDPASSAWAPTGSMTEPRNQHTATLLLNGKVLIAGAFSNENGGGVPHSEAIETYDPVSGAFTQSFDVQVCHREGAAATFLPDGRVAFNGGLSVYPCPDQIFDPGYGTLARRPRVSSTSGTLTFGSPFAVTGTGFGGDSEAASGTTGSSASNVPVVQVRSIEGGVINRIVPNPQADFGGNPMTLNFSQLPSSLNPGFQLVTVFVNGLPSLPAAGASSGVVGLTCGVAITTQPSNQVVALNTAATFSVQAQGARAYQWRRNGLAIPGANGSSYTTPAITGADSGSLYDVVVDGSCASVTSASAVVTVDDHTSPTLTVVAPSGGEFWLLSPGGGPASVEEISWSMSDNVRICRVDVSLEYSNDGGATFAAAPADASLPRQLGTGGSCAYPGVATTTLSYTIPSTYPSGRPGSLYRVRVAVADQVGNTSTSTSANPFYIVQSNPDVRTLIVTSQARFTSLFGAARAQDLLTKLNNLAVHPRVQGVVVDLTGLDYSALDAAVAANNGSPQRANDLLFASGGIHDRLLSTLRAFPGAKYAVLVGDDRVIPFARLQDGTSLFDETNYAPADISATATAVGQALEAKTFLSDDPLGLAATIRPADLGTSTFIPDLTLGRLVETPEEITTAIATFLGQDGILDLTTLDPASGHKVLVTGYDFFSDSAAQIRDRWRSVLGAGLDPAAPVDGTLIGGTWGFGSAAERKSALLARLCGNGGSRYGIASLSGHASHFLEGIPTNSFTDIDGLLTQTLADPSACGGGGLNLSGGVIYAVGCHAGLPVPGSSATDASHSLDLPQTFLSHGAAAYVANTGYGWAAKVGPGYGKKLMEFLTEKVAVPGSVVVGDAVRATKVRYFQETPALDPYDQKTLMQWTFFGLPMYAVRSLALAPAPSASVAASSTARRAPKAGAKPTVERLGSVVVRRSLAGSATAAALAAPTAPPSFVTALDLHFDFSAPGVYQKRSSTGALVSTPGCGDPNGCYYALNGLATGTTDVPVQPYFVYDSRLSGTSQHGVLWLGGTYDQESGWTPIFTQLVSNGGDGSNHGVAPRTITIKPGAVRLVPGADPQSCATSDAEVNSLVGTAGEVLTNGPTDPAYSTERRYRDMNFEVLYLNDTASPLNNCDRSGPQIGPGPLAGGQYHAVGADGTTIQFAVPASDAGAGAGVWRVVVVVNDNRVDAQGRGSWKPVELANDGTGTFRGTFSLAIPGVVTYMIQAADTHGNVSWLDFSATLTPPSASLAARRVSPSAVAAAAPPSGIPSSGVPLKVPLPVDVTLTGPAGPRIDSFAPTSGIAGTTVTILGQNFGGATAVKFDGTAADFIVSSPLQIVASVPAGAATGPIAVTTPYGTAVTSASFVVLPALSVADVTVTKPAAGTVNAVFNVSLSFASALPVKVSYATADGTAVAGTDYTATSGILTFAAGATTRAVSVGVLGNGLAGASKAFVLSLSSPVSAGIARAQATGTILRPWRTADLNGDGSADILWQDQLSGNLAGWLMAGTTRTGVTSFNPNAITDSKLQVAGFGDFNGDGRTDLLLQNQTTGALTVWLLNGTTRTGTATIAAPGAAWKVVGIADVNGDGKPDVVWQNATTNDVQVTFLNGTTPTGTAAVSPTRPGAWKVRGAADWNGDGKPDLLWQNQTTADLEVWFLNGAAKTGSQALNPGRPAVFFALAGVGDWNGDGKPDLLFRHAILGSLQTWLMNGTQRTTAVSPDGVSYPGELPGVPGCVIDPRWKVVAPR